MNTKLRLLTVAEHKAIQLLRPGAVTYFPGSFDKRFAQGMESAAELGGWISEKEGEYLRVLAHRYRRQAPEAEWLLSEAERLLAEGVEQQ